MNRRVLSVALIAVLVVVGLQLTGCRRLRPSAGPSGTATAVRLQFVVSAADPSLAAQFRVGDSVRLKDTGSVLGKISAVDSTPTVQAVPTADGRLVTSPVPNQADIRVTVDGNALVRDDGYRFDGEAVYVNQEVKVITPLTYSQVTVVSIKETGK